MGSLVLLELNNSVFTRKVKYPLPLCCLCGLVPGSSTLQPSTVEAHDADKHILHNEEEEEEEEEEEDDRRIVKNKLTK